MPGPVRALGLFGPAVLGSLCVILAAGGGGAGGAAQKLADTPAVEFQIKLPPQTSLQVGSAGTVSLTIAATPGHTVSTDAPVTLVLAVTPAEGLGLPKTRYSRKHAADARAADPRFDLRLRGQAVGRYRLEIRVRFWICGARTCRPIDEKRQVEVEISAPAPPAPPAPDVDAGA